MIASGRAPSVAAGKRRCVTTSANVAAPDGEDIPVPGSHLSRSEKRMIKIMPSQKGGMLAPPTVTIMETRSRTRPGR